MSDVTEPEPTSEILFAESGASWLWLLAGPAAGLAMFLIQLNSGLGVRWAVPLAFFVLVSAFLALQIKAARIHTSVELTPDALREGTETILVSEIVSLYPEPPAKRSYERGLMKPNAMTNRAMKRAGFDEAELAAVGEPEPDDPDAEARFPTLTAIKRAGASFTHASSPGSQTTVSLGAVFAGRYFSQMYWTMHGSGATRFAYAADDPSPRFPELLDRAGIPTVSFPSINFLAGEFGVARGFAEAGEKDPAYDVA